MSFWSTKAARGTHTCDVAVIGAGIVGLGAALAAQDAGVDALIIEQGAVGHGASGRNAGYLMRGAADNYAAAVRDWGREKARFLWRLSEANLSALHALGVSKLPGCSPRPSCLLAADDAEAQELQRSAALMLEDGFDCELVTRGDDAVWRHRDWPVALVNPRDHVCDSMEVLTLLAGKLTRPPLLGGELYGINAASDGLTLLTTQGKVSCARAIVCTNAWTGRLVPRLDRLVVPHRAQMLALDASSLIASDMPKCAYYADHGSEYLRAGDEHTILLGGKRKVDVTSEQTAAEQVTRPIQAALEAYARDVLGCALPVTHRWSGTMAFTPDGLPIVGPVAIPSAGDLTQLAEEASAAPAADGRLWICAGFNGHGMSLGLETVRRAILEMVGASASHGDGIGPMRVERFSESAPGG